MHLNRFDPPKSEIRAESAEKPLDWRSRSLVFALSVQLLTSSVALLGLAFREYFLPFSTASEVAVDLLKLLPPLVLAVWGIWSLLRRSARAPGVCVMTAIAALLHVGNGLAGALALPLFAVTLPLAVSFLWSASRSRART